MEIERVKIEEQMKKRIYQILAYKKEKRKKKKKERVKNYKPINLRSSPRRRPPFA